MYWNDLERHDGGTAIDEIWLNHPLVRAEVNRRISGDAAVWPLDWLRDVLAPELPLGSLLVVGCGTGAFEREIVRLGIARTVAGIDIAAAAVERARELAAESGLPIEYHAVDATTFLSARTAEFDAICFHASLHHFFEPETVLAQVCAALKPGGLLYLDEYVGPSRHQWNAFRLTLLNLAYRLLPAGVRRPHLVRAPINHEDPTEAPASHRIMAAVEGQFDVLQNRPYGGNLLSVVYPNLHRPPGVEPAILDRAVSRLIALERVLLDSAGAKPYYAVVLARKRPSASTTGATR